MKSCTELESEELGFELSEELDESGEEEVDDCFRFFVLVFFSFGFLVLRSFLPFFFFESFDLPRTSFSSVSAALNSVEVTWSICSSSPSASQIRYCRVS